MMKPLRSLATFLALLSVDALVSQPASTITTTTRVSLQDLLSTCIVACQCGCDEIRAVQQARQANDGQLEQQVQFKDVTDPKSALTEADQRAQQAIVSVLQQQQPWGPALTIVGEEDEENDTSKTSNEEMLSPKQQRPQPSIDLSAGEHFSQDKDMQVDLADVTVFVDPVDGTREFVEGRLHNCQALVGIALKGQAIAGVIGIPFPTNDLSSPATIVYGQVGAGYGVIGAAAELPESKANSNHPQKRPIMASGDSTIAVMTAAKNIIETQLGGTNVLYGGAGNKILATALGHVDCVVQHKFGGPWDTCAPQAICHSMGGTMTDMAGDPIRIHEADASPKWNRMGFVATYANSCVGHEELIQSLQQADEVQSYLAEGRAMIANNK
ncbi:Putative inositol monophosphatase 3 [Seminavis robusta]|uniref:3'(2'),5'-bisphosphate nucleotidase 1 n=1 Tax=Seminavis robusta TaxID=568900 RepID=A0A9N8HTW0_9STRA|nr:Putative inositol monophosphatase 3 [Seminavis robusta]|eukprot:Sro1716_g293180.1 Putative inositol monophosphatase 3 (384) ;mRNA; f:13109-14260